MAAYTVTSPVPGYTGETVGVRFAAGVGHTNNDYVAHWLAAKGYAVTPDPDDEQKKPARRPKPKP